MPSSCTGKACPASSRTFAKFSVRLMERNFSQGFVEGSALRRSRLEDNLLDKLFKSSCLLRAREASALYEGISRRLALALRSLGEKDVRLSD